MIRDMDLVQELLERLETNGGREATPPQIDGYTPAQVEYHLTLCREAGFIHYTPTQMRLTWAGHDELDRLRPEDPPEA